MSISIEVDYSGAYVEFAIPTGIAGNLVTFDCRGAGGGGPHLNGAPGSRVVGTITVIPGEILRLYVGGHGPGAQSNHTSPGGWNGGGPGGTGWGTVVGPPGGGATDVRRAPYGLADRLIVASGGAGNGRGSGGGIGGHGGGTTGANGTSGTGTGAGTFGHGGTPSAGGAAGVSTSPASNNATPGTFGQGGHGANELLTLYTPGGGGGGGWYGGGGAGGAAYVGTTQRNSGGGGGGSDTLNGNPGTIYPGGGAGNGQHGFMIVSFDALPGVPTQCPMNTSAAAFSQGMQGGGYPLAGGLLSNMPLLFRWVTNIALNPGVAIEESNLRYRLVGAGAWTTISSIVYPLTPREDNFYWLPSLPAGGYEWQVQCSDVGSHAMSAWTSSQLFTVVDPPAASYPFAALGDQWPDSTPGGVVTDAADMTERIDSPVNVLGALTAGWADNAIADKSRHADVGLMLYNVASYAVAANQPVNFDTIVQIGDSFPIFDPNTGTVLIPMSGLYVISYGVTLTPGSAGGHARLVGLPSPYGSPGGAFETAHKPGSRIGPIFAQLAGGETLSVQSSVATTFAGTPGISLTDGYKTYFELWRIGR